MHRGGAPTSRRGASRTWPSYSRSGLPLTARARNQKGVSTQYRARFLKLDVVRAMRAQRKLDFRNDILPLLWADMQYAYYEAYARLKRDTLLSVLLLNQFVATDSAAQRDQMVRQYIPEADRFDWESLVDPIPCSSVQVGAGVRCLAAPAHRGRPGRGCKRQRRQPDQGGVRRGARPARHPARRHRLRRLDRGVASVADGRVRAVHEPHRGGPAGVAHGRAAGAGRRRRGRHRIRARRALCQVDAGTVEDRLGAVARAKDAGRCSRQGARLDAQPCRRRFCVAARLVVGRRGTPVQRTVGFIPEASKSTATSMS